MSKIILAAETGADIPPELAQRYNIQIVPMHVSFGDVTRDDGTFPSEEICAYYERTGELPKPAPAHRRISTPPLAVPTISGLTQGFSIWPTPP